MLGRSLELFRGPAWALILLAAAALILFVAHMTAIQAASVSHNDADAVPGSGSASLTGRLLDPHGEPVGGAAVNLVLNGDVVSAGSRGEGAGVPDTGEPLPPAESQPDGTFVFEVPMPALGVIETLPLGRGYRRGTVGKKRAGCPW